MNWKQSDIPLLVSLKGGVAERSGKYCEASADREARVVFRMNPMENHPSLRLRAAALALRGGDTRRGMARYHNRFRFSMTAATVRHSVAVRDRQLLRRIKRNDLRAFGCEDHHFFNAGIGNSICSRAEGFDCKHHPRLQLVWFDKGIQTRDQRPLVKAEAQAVAEVQPECRHLALEPDIGSCGQLFGYLIGAEARLQHRDRVVHPLARALVRVTLRLGRAADRERPVIARAIADEGMDDVEIRLIAGTYETIREVVRMRAATLTRNRV